jgi:sugar phosphate permease
VSDTDDPVIERRARMSRLAGLGRRAGYSLFALAMVVFFVGLATSFTETLATSIIVALVLGSILLAPAIVVGYAVKAADRADREGDW